MSVIRVEGQYFRVEAIDAVLIPESDQTQVIIRVGGLDCVLRHTGVDDPHEAAIRTREAIARAVWGSSKIDALRDPPSSA